MTAIGPAAYAGTADYIASPELMQTVNVAVTLSRPLLIKGEPGTGKTMLAQSIARSLGMGLIAWNIKSTTKAQDGLYVYDTVQRLYDGQFGDRDVADIARYIKLGKLGEAFTAPERVVLLIDEIDKADLEFPNDLLWELDQMEFYIPETHETISATQRPIVIITSNAEKELPDAFLRRCVFHFIEFPDTGMMTRIVRVHHPDLDQRLLDLSLQAFYWLREVPGLQKKPSTSELIDWVQALQVGGVRHEDIVATLPFLGVLLKKDHDVAVACVGRQGGSPVDIRFDFDALSWQSPLPGMRFKSFVSGDRRVRLLEFSPGFEEPDWCTSGHAGRVLEGSLTLRFRDGSDQRLAAGDDLVIEAGGAQTHKAILGPDESARLLLFESVAAAPPRSGAAPPRLTDPAVVVIDVQPGFGEAIARTSHGASLDLSPLLLRLEKLLVMAGCLELPTLATFERPHVNEWFAEALEAVWPASGQRFVKQTYDCCGEPEIVAAIAGLDKRQLLVAGGETDVCVLQSVLSLLGRGYEVFLLEDCIFTTEPYPAPAVRRMEAAGAVPCTLKTAYYELMKSVALYDDPAALGPAWERLEPLFGEPEYFPPWPPPA